MVIEVSVTIETKRQRVGITVKIIFFYVPLTFSRFSVPHRNQTSPASDPGRPLPTNTQRLIHRLILSILSVPSASVGGELIAAIPRQ